MTIERLAAAEVVRARSETRMADLLAEEPDNRWYLSIVAQLEALRGPLIRGEVPENNERFNFGFLAVRFINEVDPSLSQDLAELADYVEHEYGRGSS